MMEREAMASVALDGETQSVEGYSQAQLFEGSIVDRQRYTLRVGPDLDTEKKIEFGKRVRGRFEGVVAEVSHKQKRDGSVIRVHVVEVDDVEIL